MTDPCPTPRLLGIHRMCGHWEPSRRIGFGPTAELRGHHRLLSREGARPARCSCLERRAPPCPPANLTGLPNTAGQPAPVAPFGGLGERGQPKQRPSRQVRRAPILIIGAYKHGAIWGLGMAMYY